MTTTSFSQVGGHASTILLSASDSSIINKPSSPNEHRFYSSLAPSLFGEDFVGSWTPGFYGTLTLQGKVGEDGSVQGVGKEEGEGVGEMLVLENLTYRFVKPNVLDIKLGTQLFDEDASEEKKERMTATAKATTSAETGVRLTGFQVFDSATQTFIKTPKSYGKTIPSSELPFGIARFFYPPLSISPSFPQDSLAKPLPLDLLLPILKGIIRRIERLEKLLSNVEMRIRGGSLLIVIEGDAEALRLAVERESSAPTPRPSTTDEEEEEDAEEESDTESISTTDGEGNAKPHTLIPWDLKLIDFAHARSAVGEGPDEGFLKGLRSSRELIEGLVGKLEKEVVKVE